MNTLEVADAVKAVLPSLAESLPASTKLTILARRQPADQGLGRRDPVHHAAHPGPGGDGDLPLHPQHLGATVIPSLSLPMSIIGTFAVMYLLGYSLDNMSLMALTLSVGFVVDDSIVMLENIVRHMEMGKSRMQAALDGAREVGFTIISMTFSLVAIFIPLFFLGGMMGRLFREFAVTIGVAVLVSGVISLTLTPMLCSRFLREPHRIHHGRIYLATEAMYQATGRGCMTAACCFVLRHRLATMLSFPGHAGGNRLSLHRRPEGLHPFRRPRHDHGLHRDRPGHLLAVPGGSHACSWRQLLQKDPNVDRFLVDVDTSAFMLVVLKPRAERRAEGRTGDPGTAAQTQLGPRHQGHADQPAADQCRRPPDPQPLPADPAGARYSISSMRSAKSWNRRCATSPSLLDVSSDLQLENPELNVEIDRDRALLLGISPRQIEDTLYSAYGKRVVSTINGANDQYDVIMEFLPRYRTDASVLDKLYIRSSQGKLVPLTSVASAARGGRPAVDQPYRATAFGDPVVQYQTRCRPGRCPRPI